MPRPSRHNNARNKQKHISQAQLSPRPSPPTQLPTPLPEEERISSTMHRPETSHQVADDYLIDFDTPTPPPSHPIYFSPTDSALDIDLSNLQDEQDDIQPYRSPPFREAHLPDLQPVTPPPLPIPPRLYKREEVYDDQSPIHGGQVDSELTSSPGGHTRWPTYSR